VAATEQVYIDVHQAARRYGMSHWWFYHQSSAGEIQSHHLGKYLRFKPEELDRYFEALDSPGGDRG